MKKESSIRRYSAEELGAMQARGEGLSDLARVRAKSEAELEADIGSDPDFSESPRDWYKAAEAMPTAKKVLSFRLDSEIVDWFKAQGPGYQTRMNAALLAFVRASRKTHA